MTKIISTLHKNNFSQFEYVEDDDVLYCVHTGPATLT